MPFSSKSCKIQQCLMVFFHTDTICAWDMCMGQTDGRAKPLMRPVSMSCCMRDVMWVLGVMFVYYLDCGYELWCS